MMDDEWARNKRTADGCYQQLRKHLPHSWAGCVKAGARVPMEEQKRHSPWNAMIYC